MLGHVWHPVGSTVACFNRASQLGFGPVSLEGLLGLEAMHALLKEWHATFPSKKTSINIQQLASAVSIGWALRLARPSLRSNFLLGHCLSIFWDPDYEKSEF